MREIPPFSRGSTGGGGGASLSEPTWWGSILYPHLLPRTTWGKGQDKPLSPTVLCFLLESSFRHASLVED